MSKSENEKRREFWTAKMEEAFDFMQKVTRCPVEECGEGLVSIEDAASGAGVKVDFSKTKSAGEFDRLFLLRKGLVGQLLSAAAELNEKGMVLKVEDAFRTREMQKRVATQDRVLGKVVERLSWETGADAPPLELVARRLSVLCAAIPKTASHMSGCALDVSVIERASGREVDRGAPYIELSEKTPMSSPFVGEAARKNREMITSLMRRHGFVAYPYEFWHYSAGDAYESLLAPSGKTARYGAVDFDPARKTVRPVAGAIEPLNSPAELEERMKRVMGKKNP